MKLKARKANITLYINIKYEICLSKYLSLRIIFQFSQRSGKSSSNARMTKPNSWKRMINCFTCGLDQRRSPSPSEQTQQKPTSTRISKYVFLFSRAETDSPESDICKQAQIFFFIRKKNPNFFPLPGIFTTKEKNEFQIQRYFCSFVFLHIRLSSLVRKHFLFILVIFTIRRKQKIK